MIELPPTLCETNQAEVVSFLDEVVDFCDVLQCDQELSTEVTDSVVVLCDCPLPIEKAPFQEKRITKTTEMVLCYENFIKAIVQQKLCQNPPRCS